MTVYQTILTLLVLALVPLLGSCASIKFDPGEGAEVVILQTLQHSDRIDLVYQRTPEQGPVVIRQNTWTYFYSIPVNRMELADWIYLNLPEGTEAANLKAETWIPWWGYFLFIPTLGMVRVDRLHYEFDPVRVVFMDESAD